MKPSDRINQKHEVTETTVEISLDEGFVEAPVKVSMELSPRPQLILDYELSRTEAAASNEINAKGEVKVRLENGKHFETIVGNRMGLGGGKVWNVLMPKSEPVTVRGGDALLSECEFSLINFPNVWSEDDIWQLNGHGSNSRTLAAQRFHLRASPWVITIDGVEDLMGMHYSLIRRGGSAITHKGTIARADGHDFSVDDLGRLLNALHLFLSFARGSYCGLTFLKGRDADQNCAWEQWGTYKVEPWRRELQSWADFMEGHTMTLVFEGLWKLLNDPSQSDAVSQVVNWYLRSNESSEPEVSMVLKAALERLTNNAIGKKKKVAENESGEEFTRDWINRALKNMGIDSRLPSECVELSQLSGLRNWLHGPQALVSIRNKLVHPSKTDVAISDSALLEAQALGLHYVELMLLKLSGHTGRYLNRSKYNYPYHIQIETVPWAVTGKP